MLSKFKANLSRVKEFYSKESNYKANCKECNKDFYRVHKGKSYCSDICSNRSNNRKSRKKYGNKHRKRAKYYGVNYEPVNIIKVFERDKWVCKICGTKTPKLLRGKNLDNSPELDHIIPLSKGGEHIYDNVQCCCRKCNMSKSNYLIGQLRLNIA